MSVISDFLAFWWTGVFNIRTSCIEKSYVSIALLVTLDYLVGVPNFPTSLVNLIYKVRGRHENCPPQIIYLYCTFIIPFLFILVKNFFISNQLSISTVSDFP